MIREVIYFYTSEIVELDFHEFIVNFIRHMYTIFSISLYSEPPFYVSVFYVFPQFAFNFYGPVVF
jgi:hypothetical protein